MQKILKKIFFVTSESVLITSGLAIILFVSIISYYQFLLLRADSFDYVKKIRTLNRVLFFALAGCFVLVFILIQKIRSIRKQQKESDFKFISLIAASNEATFMVDKKGAIHFANKNAESLFGYSNDELKNQHIELLLPGEYFSPGVHKLNTPEAKIDIQEIIIVNKKGKASLADLTLIQIKSCSDLFFIATVSTINEEMKAGVKFHSLFNAIPDATIIVNEKGLIETINEQTINIFGYTRDEIIGQPVEILIPLDARARHSHHQKQFQEESHIRLMDTALDLNALKKDGTQFPVEISLAPIKFDENVAVIASVRDISARINKDEELRKSEELFQLLVNSIKDFAIFIIDINGCVATWNSGAEALLGYQTGEILGKPINVFYTEQGTKNNEPTMDLEKASINGSHETECWRIRKNGSAFNASIIINALKDSHGIIYAYTKITREITGDKLSGDH